MKTRILLLSLVIFLYSTIANAQDEMFKVLASKGTNKVQINGAGEAAPLFAGKKLSKGDKITISEGGYLGLFFTKNGKTIELKKAGTYEVAKLASEVANQNASTAVKYGNYLAGEMGKTGNEDMTKNRYKYMSATGSVERGGGLIKVWSPEKVEALGGSIFLKWELNKDVKTYVVEVTNMFGDKVAVKETTEASIVIALDSKKDKSYVWKVYSKDDINVTSDPYSVKFLADDKASELNKQVTELKTSLGGESALNKIVLASFYEENKLYADAMQAYEEASKLEPGVEDYQVAYGQFLERAGLAKPQEKK